MFASSPRVVGSNVGVQMSPIIIESSALYLHPRVERKIVECFANMLLSIGMITEPVQWLKDADYVMPIIIVVQLWMSM